jgi:hypothetical protein
MGFYTDSYKQLLTDFDAAFGKQREVISGTIDAANREADANQAIAASRGGYSGSALEKTLFSRNKALFAGQKATALNTLAASQESQRTGLKQAAIQGELADKTAGEDMWGNLATGAGNILGTALSIFGGPAGIAAGAGINAVTGMARDATSNKAASAMGYTIPEFKVQPIAGLN